MLRINARILVFIAIGMFLCGCMQTSRFNPKTIDDISVKLIPSKSTNEKGLFLKEMTEGQKKIFIRLLSDSKKGISSKDSVLLEGEYEFEVLYSNQTKKTYRIDSLNGFYESDSGTIFLNPKLTTFCQQLFILSVLDK